MAANAFVRARIDEDLKNQAADVLAGSAPPRAGACQH